MGWVWRDDDDDEGNNDNGKSFNNITEFESSNNRYNNSGGGDGEKMCSTRRIVQSKCNTEEVEPGKFIRKCEKTDKLLKDCLGKPTEIVQSNTEYTEDDVTDEVMKGSSGTRPFDFPGLRSDIDAIERSFLGGINRFFEAADGVRNSFFDLMDDPTLFGGQSSSSSRREGIPIEEHIQKEPRSNLNNSDSGSLDIAGLARDV